MGHKTRTCKSCDKKIPGGNLTRHMKRKHGAASSLRPLPPPIEHRATVREVLLACDFDPGCLKDWGIEDLDSLPNIRNYRPTPHRCHTPWQFVTYDQLSTLPSLEKLLVHLPAPRKSNSAYKGAELWRDNEQTQFTPQEWLTWTTQILEHEEPETRVLNMPMRFVRAEAKHNYSQHAADAIRQHFPDLEAHGSVQKPADANITPRGTRTEVHHDSEHHISTAVGLKSRGRRPLKLWLLWPSTELRHLASCYSDTKAALACMNHGSFLVQMPGESVVVPPNSPHAVFALDSCYLYGHIFSAENWAYEPSSVLVDIRVGDSPEESCRARILQVSLGLCGNTKLRQAFIDQFIETWAVEAAVFREQKELFELLVELWTTDTSNHGSCAWCAAAGKPRDPGPDSREHMRAHLESRSSPTPSTTASIV
jgi:hypothetical protein